MESSDQRSSPADVVAEAGHVHPSHVDDTLAVDANLQLMCVFVYKTRHVLVY